MKKIIIFMLLFFSVGATYANEFEGYTNVGDYDTYIASQGGDTSTTATSTGSGSNTNDITKKDFVINVGQISPGGTTLSQGNTTEQTVNNVLLKILEMLIVVFGVIAVFIMTVGAGYMIIYHGQDEFLSKGKTIFMSGIISLVVALSAGLLVRLLLFLLY